MTEIKKNNCLVTSLMPQSLEEYVQFPPPPGVMSLENGAVRRKKAIKYFSQDNSPTARLSNLKLTFLPGQL